MSLNIDEHNEHTLRSARLHLACNILAVPRDNLTNALHSASKSLFDRPVNEWSANEHVLFECLAYLDETKKNAVPQARFFSDDNDISFYDTL